MTDAELQAEEAPEGHATTDARFLALLHGLVFFALVFGVAAAFAESALVCFEELVVDFQLVKQWADAVWVNTVPRRLHV